MSSTGHPSPRMDAIGRLTTDARASYPDMKATADVLLERVAPWAGVYFDYEVVPVVEIEKAFPRHSP